MSDMKLDGSVAARQKAAETKAGRPGIVCLCGSGRFRDAFDAAEEAETLRGRIVLTIGCNTKDVARSAELVGHKPMLDELHLRKIDLADEVLILNVDGYIGESTARELAYARSRGKAVRFLETQSDIGLTIPNVSASFAWGGRASHIDHGEPSSSVAISPQPSQREHLSDIVVSLRRLGGFA